MADLLPFLGGASYGRDKFLEWLGRDSHPSSGGKDVLHIRTPAFPAMRFEWHPQRRRVYLINVGQVPEIGQTIAEHVETHGHACNFVNTFLRGYRMRAAEQGIIPSLAE